MSFNVPYIMQPRVVERHFLDLRKKYGNVLAVDLVNKVHILVSMLLTLGVYLIFVILTT